MANNEGTVTIPIDRYLELTKFVDDILKNKVLWVYSIDNKTAYLTINKDDLLESIKINNDDFERHNSALQQRIADFNSKPWYQRVFKSNV